MLTAERLRELLDYDPETGILRWKVQRGGYAKPGKVAGSPDKLGYILIVVDQIKYKAHRLAWLHFYGNWPKKNIDHVDGVSSDNRIAKLREATQSQNLQNTAMRSENTSGFKGVWFHKQRNKFAAEIMVNKKKIHLGLFHTIEEAAAARKCASKKYFGEFSRAE